MTVIEELDTGVIELDRGNRITLLNGAAEQGLAHGRERLEGLSIDQVEGIPEDLIEALQSTRTDNRARRLHECRLAGGLYDCNIRPLDDQRVLLELYNLEWEQQRQQLLQREIQTGLLDLLRRNLGHEIRNPLGGIRGAAQMMAAELGEQELGTLARLVMREVDRIEDLIQRFWQPESDREELDIHGVIEEALELAAAESTGQVRIERDYDPSIPPITGDSLALRQLALNLVRNACQAGAGRLSACTRVEIGSALVKNGPRSAVRFDLEDDGEGVPEDLRPLLFMPMVTGKRDGTGLGLALAQQIAAAHGGILTYEPLPSGSRFSLRLPLNDSKQAAGDSHD